MANRMGRACGSLARSALIPERALLAAHELERTTLRARLLADAVPSLAGQLEELLRLLRPTLSGGGRARASSDPRRAPSHDRLAPSCSNAMGSGCCSYCNRTIVIPDGRVVQDDSPGELDDQPGLFRGVAGTALRA